MRFEFNLALSWRFYRLGLCGSLVSLIPLRASTWCILLLGLSLMCSTYLLSHSLSCLCLRSWPLEMGGLIVGRSWLCNLVLLLLLLSSLPLIHLQSHAIGQIDCLARPQLNSHLLLVLVWQVILISLLALPLIMRSLLIVWLPVNLNSRSMISFCYLPIGKSLQTMGCSILKVDFFSQHISIMQCLEMSFWFEPLLHASSVVLRTSWLIVFSEYQIIIAVELMSLGLVCLFSEYFHAPSLLKAGHQVIVQRAEVFYHIFRGSNHSSVPRQSLILLMSLKAKMVQQVHVANRGIELLSQPCVKLDEELAVPSNILFKLKG